MQICRPFHYSANAADSTVRKTHRLIEMMNCAERPPDKRDRSRARGRKVFGQIRTLALRISAGIRQLAKMAVCPLRCMIAQNYAEITRTHEVSKSGSSPVGHPDYFWWSHQSARQGWHSGC